MNRLNDAMKGLFCGAILGAFAGLGVCMWLLTETILFSGDTMVAGALICGAAGWMWGDDFFDLLREHWGWFT